MSPARFLFLSYMIARSKAEFLGVSLGLCEHGTLMVYGTLVEAEPVATSERLRAVLTSLRIRHCPSSFA